jgi:hypothetical protein
MLGADGSRRSGGGLPRPITGRVMRGEEEDVQSVDANAGARNEETERSMKRAALLAGAAEIAWSLRRVGRRSGATTAEVLGPFPDDELVAASRKARGLASV